MNTAAKLAGLAGTTLLVAGVGLSSLIGWSANAAQPGAAPPASVPLGMSMNRLMGGRKQDGQTERV